MMVWAICVCVPMASMVTMAPASSRRCSSSGIAMISLDFSVTASCPSTSCCRVAQAETVCSGPRPLDRAWLRREVLPSIAIVSGPATRSRSTQLVKQVLNNSGSIAAITSHIVSWLGMPRANGRKRRRNARCSSPHRVSSTKSSAPATVPHSSNSSSSGNGYSTFAACLGSRSAANWLRNGTAAACTMGYLQ